MASTHLVLQGVKEYTRELLGTKQRDEAVAAAGRSEAGAATSSAAAALSESAAGTAQNAAGRAEVAAEVATSAAVAGPGLAGAGAPEGVVAAPVGTVYTDTNGTAGAVRWLKATGTGTTGWRVLWGDTGWLDIRDTAIDQASFLPGGTARIKRANDRVSLALYDLNFSASGSVLVANLPLGFRPLYRDGFRVSISNNDSREGVALPTTFYVYGVPSEGGRIRSTLSWDTQDPWTPLA